MHTGSDWHEYDYTTQLGPAASMVSRPLIEVVISCRTSSAKIRMLALIDSGTDGTILHADIARSLGINPAECQRATLGGIGTTDNAFITNVKIAVPDFDITMEGPVIFAEGIHIDVLLGQRDFFQRFDIRFEKNIGKFFLASTT
jgi:hypothetical protein